MSGNLRELRGRTAMRRRALSRPVQQAVELGLLTKKMTFFDYGCGRGDDVETLVSEKYRAQGWDPAHFPENKISRADVVNLGFVVNVIEDVTERTSVLKEAWELAKRVLLVSARLYSERDELHVTRHGDGWLSGAGTFQKFYAHEELGEWITSKLGASAVAVGLGVFAVFRDSSDRQQFEIERLRSRIVIPDEVNYADRKRLKSEIYSDVLAFVTRHGRSPKLEELPSLPTNSTAGSISSAVRVIRAVHGDDWWESCVLRGKSDLLVYLALEAFRGRSKFSENPLGIQYDVKALLGNYTKACATADQLLSACGDPKARAIAMRASPVGKRTGNGLYVHISALDELPTLLRMYEGCALQVAGERPGNIVKLWADNATVSYLDYPEFDDDEHPALAQSVVVDLQGRSVKVSSYRQRENPPILHRKELFVSTSYPLRDKFDVLTREEVAAGLYADTSTIGTRNGWQAALEQLKIVISGHRVISST